MATYSLQTSLSSIAPRYWTNLAHVYGHPGPKELMPVGAELIQARFVPESQHTNILNATSYIAAKNLSLKYTITLGHFLASLDRHGREGIAIGEFPTDEWRIWKQQFTIPDALMPISVHLSRPEMELPTTN